MKREAKYVNNNKVVKKDSGEQKIRGSFGSSFFPPYFLTNVILLTPFSQIGSLRSHKGGKAEKPTAENKSGGCGDGDNCMSKAPTLLVNHQTCKH